MPRFHGATLDEVQRLLLEKTVRSGTASARTVTRAHILLKADTRNGNPVFMTYDVQNDKTFRRAVKEHIRPRVYGRQRGAASLD